MYCCRHTSDLGYTPSVNLGLLQEQILDSHTFLRPYLILVPFRLQQVHRSAPVMMHRVKVGLMAYSPRHCLARTRFIHSLVKVVKRHDVACCSRHAVSRAPTR